MRGGLLTISGRAFSSFANSKLFVGGLTWSADERSIEDDFSSFGEVTEVKTLYDKDGGRSGGFEFVSFSKEDEAISAKDGMDRKLSGRHF